MFDSLLFYNDKLYKIGGTVLHEEEPKKFVDYLNKKFGEGSQAGEKTYWSAHRIYISLEPNHEYNYYSFDIINRELEQESLEYKFNEFKKFFKGPKINWGGYPESIPNLKRLNISDGDPNVSSVYYDSKLIDYFYYFTNNQLDRVELVTENPTEGEYWMNILTSEFGQYDISENKPSWSVNGVKFWHGANQTVGYYYVALEPGRETEIKVKKDKIQKYADYKSISLEDLTLDMDILEGENIKIEGLATYTHNGHIVVSDNGDLNGAVVKVSHLPRDTRKYLLKYCDGINNCKVTVYGTVEHAKFTDRIVADRITWQFSNIN